MKVKLTYTVTGCTIKGDTEQTYNVIKRFTDKLTTLYDYTRKDHFGRPTISRQFGLRRPFMNEVVVSRGDGEVIEGKIRDFGITCDVKYLDKVRTKIQPVDIVMAGDKTPYDYQQKIIDSVVTRYKQGKPLSLLSLQTGKGKTFISINAVTELGGRLILITLPSHIEQWSQVIQAETNISADEIIVPKGSKALDKFLDDSYDKYKAVLIPSSTLHILYKKYEDELETMKKPRHDPYTLFKNLNGVVLIDEVDELPVCHYTTLALGLPIPVIIAMSASFFDSKKQLNNIYYNMFPEETRLETKIDKYINYTTLLYRFNDLTGEPVSSYYGQETYSHIAYEKWILKNPKIRKQYLNLIKSSIFEDYIRNRDKKEYSLLIFVAGLDMVECIQNRIFNEPPFAHLPSYSYTGESSDLDKLLKASLIVTTTSKSKAGLDKPGLITVIDTTNEPNARSNVQKPGRLRKIEGKNIYINFVNHDIPRQMEFSKRVYPLLRARVKNITAYNVDIPDDQQLEKMYVDYKKNLLL